MNEMSGKNSTNRDASNAQHSRNVPFIENSMPKNRQSNY